MNRGGGVAPLMSAAGYSRWVVVTSGVLLFQVGTPLYRGTSSTGEGEMGRWWRSTGRRDPRCLILDQEVADVPVGGLDRSLLRAAAHLGGEGRGFLRSAREGCRVASPRHPRSNASSTQPPAITPEDSPPNLQLACPCPRLFRRLRLPEPPDPCLVVFLTDAMLASADSFPRDCIQVYTSWTTLVAS